MPFPLQRINLAARRVASRASSGWFLAGLLVALCVWGWLDVRQRGFLYPVDKHRTDLTVYTEAGAAFFDGRDPYEVTNVRGWGYLYPPLFAMLLAPLHPLPTQDQVLVWYAISLLFLWGVYHELGRIVGYLANGPVSEQQCAPSAVSRWGDSCTVAPGVAVQLPPQHPSALTPRDHGHRAKHGHGRLPKGEGR